MCTYLREEGIDKEWIVSSTTMSGSDDTLACGKCDGVDKISSDNKTCTSYAQKVEHKDVACDNTNSMSNNSDDNCSAVSKELDSDDTSTAFTFLPPKNEADINKTKTKSNTNKDIFRFGPARSNSVSNSIDKIVEDVGKLTVSDVDDKLFADPPPNEDCPICMLPIPFSTNQGASSEVSMAFQSCCGKMICTGCIVASAERMKQGTLKIWCPYCRSPINWMSKGLIKRLEKRMKSKNADSFYCLGNRYYKGDLGLTKDIKKAMELWSQGAELGSINAHFSLGQLFFQGHGVDIDANKAMAYMKVAAIGGHEHARVILGHIEDERGFKDLALKHFMIAAKSGYDDALKEVREGYKTGYVTKDEYANTLRAHQKTRDEMKSEQRRNAAGVLGALLR